MRINLIVGKVIFLINWREKEKFGKVPFNQKIYVLIFFLLKNEKETDK